ncbi:hypothetical protein BKA70DRAFT_1426146 [Coprinopsis sp. MPI-PUGE-AT-0042]|nr:hypothetical protein BKA70DRAFT_1426146 [Coprinopsis sp. MPI-PUGE-AT-0042]
MSEIPPLPEILKQQLIVSTACQYAGSFLEVLACVVGVVSLVFNALPPDTLANSKYGLDIQAASAFLSAFGILSATGLISYRLLQARREASNVLLREDSSIYTKVVGDND